MVCGVGFWRGQKNDDQNNLGCPDMRGVCAGAGTSGGTPHCLLQSTLQRDDVIGNGASERV